MVNTIKVNTVDITSLLTPVGYQVGYQPVTGRWGGYTLDGKFHPDVLAVKAVLTANCMPLTAQQIAGILGEYVPGMETPVEVYYFDPRLGDYRIMEALAGAVAQKYVGVGANGSDYFTGTILVFTEQ